MNKNMRVVLSGGADRAYVSLNEVVGDKIKRGIKSSFHQTLLRSIKRATDLLKKNPFSGNQIQKRLIPKSYILK